jgi:hypothetical protein
MSLANVVRAQLWLLAQNKLKGFFRQHYRHHDAHQGCFERFHLSTHSPALPDQMPSAK